jgi:pyroglutamyl-peptidase
VRTALRRRVPAGPCVLLTGFEPFDGEAVNPSAQIVAQLDGDTITGHRVVTRILPVRFTGTRTRLARALADCRPTMAIALGQAGGRAGMSLERVAINLIDARIGDDTGSAPIDRPVVADAPAAYFASLPLKAMRESLHAAGIPAELSYTAGSYVCNQAFYLLLHLVAGSALPTRAGFVHVPLLPEQAARHPGQPSMALATMVAGVRAAIACALATRRDRRTTAGAIA